MIRRTALSSIVLLAGMSGAASAGPASDAVRYFYEHPGVESLIESRDRFTGMAKDYLDANDRAWTNHEQVCLDFAFPIDAQDADDDEILSTLELDERAQGEVALVTASFSNFGMAQTIEWSLIEEDGAWKVFDVASPANGWRLSELSCPA